LCLAFAGPNIYIRCLNGLLCPIPEEQEFALHHLVKVSHERGDKFKFQSFPGLVEAVVKKGLEISSLFYDVTWDVVYDNDSMMGPHCLNGATGTSDILARINHHPSITPRDDIRSKEFTYKLERLNEAGLVLRNMTMLEENAQHLSEFPIVKDFLCIALNLPNDPNASEFKHYALEVAEQLTIYWEFKPGDPLLQSLIGLLGSKDRGTVLGALVSINRASMELETNNNLTDVPILKIAYLIELARQDDEELVGACMDFLYQFTAHPQNVEAMLKELNLARDLVPRLISLLMYGVRAYQRRISPRGPVQKPLLPVEIPQFPRELIEEIGKLVEPDRSIKWLQCCFEENEEQEVTQIHLWQSYQSCFAEFTTPANQMLQASEFIKRVSSTFNGATAQVINGTQPRFIIKGIQPKKKPRALDGRIHENCKWTQDGKACPHHFFNAEEGFHHIAQDHLGIIRDENNEYSVSNDDKSKKYACFWAGCAGYGKDRGDSRAVMRHVRPHLEKPQAPKTDAAKQELPGSGKVITYQATQQDERGNPAGLPLTSVLILRNLARYASRLDQGEQLMWDLFAADRQKLFDVFANNVALQNYMADLMLMVDGHIKRRP
jgi:chromatin structure-remodeling complex subunit RSC9